MKKGIDISKWQGTVDFAKVKDAGIEFVILREGAGNSIDSRFLSYVQGCKAAGIPILGVYHFSYALNEYQAREEARFAVENVERAGLGSDTVIFYDFEYDTVNKAADVGVKLTRKECVAHTRSFCEYVTSCQRKAGIYCNLDYYRNWYNVELLNKYQLWLAYWNGENQRPPYTCRYHQYTSQGSVPGISGNVDMNLLYDDAVPEEKKSIGELVEEVLQGKWGNGDGRKAALTAAGYDYAAVQKAVNEKVSAASSSAKTVDEVVREVIQGKWGNGEARKKALTEAGYSYTEVQGRVNAFYAKR